VGYKLRFTDITTLCPYMFAVGGALWGCIVAWLLINYVSHNLLLLASLFLYLGAAYVLILLVRIFYNQTKPIKKVKWRTRTNICNVWYSK